MLENQNKCFLADLNLNYYSNFLQLSVIQKYNEVSSDNITQPNTLQVQVSSNPNVGHSRQSSRGRSMPRIVESEAVEPRSRSVSRSPSAKSRPGPSAQRVDGADHNASASTKTPPPLQPRSAGRDQYRVDKVNASEVEVNN